MGQVRQSALPVVTDELGVEYVEGEDLVEGHVAGATKACLSCHCRAKCCAAQ
jgi:hypothetical protein